jgi:hypothetical protein
MSTDDAGRGKKGVSEAGLEEGGREVARMGLEEQIVICYVTGGVFGILL